MLNTFRKLPNRILGKSRLQVWQRWLKHPEYYELNLPSEFLRCSSTAVSIGTSIVRTLNMTKPVVTVQQGKVRGKIRKNYEGEKYYSFKGIPYAKPPVGELRFKAPEPPEPWEGTFDAFSNGAPCPSKHMVLPYTIGKESSCLNLNVFTRDLPSEKQKLKPVMVWIHGGGFTFGSNKTDLYGPQYLMMEDIVLVCINYRLGVFGFLSIEDESFEIPGNAGLKDQVMALRWVQNNIKSFNGDPDNVTIFGESAGGCSVHFLVLSPLAKGLFHKAIMQSGSALNCWALGTKGTDEICKTLGYKEKDQKKIVDYLRKISATKLSKATYISRDAFLPGERRFYAPVIEKPSPNAFISDTPENIIKSGNYNHVPMIIGYTSREGFLFEILRKNHPSVEYSKEFLPEIDYRIHPDEEKRKEISETVQRYYYNSDGKFSMKKNLESTILMKTDTMFVYHIHEAINLHQKTATCPIYVYRMSLDTSLNVVKGMAIAQWSNCYFLTNYLSNKFQQRFVKEQLDKLATKFVGRQFPGTSHADDLGYLFKMFFTPAIEPGSIEDISIRRFVRMWTNFAKYGNPTPEEKDELLNVKWEPVEGEKNYLDLGEKLTMIENPDIDRMKFWGDLYNSYCTAN